MSRVPCPFTSRNWRPFLFRSCNGDSSVGQQQTYTIHHLSREMVEQGQTKTMTPSNVVDLAYSADASMLAVVTEDKRVWVWRRTPSGDEIKKREPPLSTPEEKRETEPREKRQELLGWRELPKKPTSVTFAPAVAGDRYSGSEKGEVRNSEVGMRVISVAAISRKQQLRGLFSIFLPYGGKVLAPSLNPKISR